MGNIKAASRYAKALLDLAIENNQLDKLQEDMASLKLTVNGSKELADLLKSPIVKGDQKEAALKAIFAKDFSDLGIKYISTLVSNNREALLPEISTQFQALFEAHNNIVTAEVTSAIALDSIQKEKVLSLIKHDGKINLIEKVDASLIGGFIIRVGDKQIDASIAKKFKDLKKEIILN